jgi:O-antigen ligase
MPARIEDGGASAPARAARRFDGWGIYLLLAVALAPLVVPTGPAQLSILDPFNVVAVVGFGAALITRRVGLRAPFAAVALVILIGSSIALFNAESVPAGILALVQDAYLYAWFIALVSVMSTRGDLVGLRVAWVWTANAVALYGIAMVLVQGHTTLGRMLGPRGMRAIGTFSDPNMFADYLGMSLFVLLSLGRHVSRGLRAFSIGLLLLAILASKSNGGALSLLVGLVVWAAVRARTLRMPIPALGAAALLVVSVGLLGWWMNAGLGIGEAGLRELRSHSFLARAAHSSEGRLKIWNQLEQTWARSPLGIGPGNSRWVTLSVEQRERPNSMYSKEAHNDYLAYAIERGPLAVLALLVMMGQAFAKVAGAWKRRVRPGRANRSASAMAAGLAGALACSAIHSLTLERLHFRHYWLLLAMVCALAESARVRRAEPEESRAADEVPGALVAQAGA